MKTVTMLVTAAAVIFISVSALPGQFASEMLSHWAWGRLLEVNAAVRPGAGEAGDDAKLGEFDPARLRLADAQIRPITNVINTTGTIAPVALVNVSSLVSGQVKELFVDFNSDVRQGQAIAKFDPATFQNALSEAEAELAITQANIVKAQIALRESEADLQRKRVLLSGGSGSLLEQTKSTAVRDLAAANLMEANATLKKAEAVASQASANLERTTIRSPTDGTVIHRGIEVGQIITVSLTAPTLFTIAQDLRAMKLDALVSEGDIGRVRVGQRVSFTVDAYPDRNFDGEVSQIRKQPQNNQNVVIYTVVTTAPNADRLLLPGMTATTRIIIDERPPSLAIPNAALRVRLADGVRADATRVFIEKNGRTLPVAIRALVADGAFTQVESGELRPGDRVIVGLAPKPATKPSAARSLIGGL